MIGNGVVKHGAGDKPLLIDDCKFGTQPRKIITDKFASYKAALRDIGTNTPHITEQYKNNIAEVSHQNTRQQQRQMRQFKSIAQAQRFLAGHRVLEPDKN